MTQFNRGTGLIIIEVRNSNPNGDPDQESDPRTYNDSGHGLISPVSYKRKIRDLIADWDSPAMEIARRELKIGDKSEANQYQILESRGRDRKMIEKMKADEFIKTYWDGRVFGNTFLESTKGKAAVDNAHFISTGTVQIGLGVSVAPVEIERLTQTNKAGVQGDKDRGMAPLGFRVVRHGLYTIPFFVNPMMARKSGCTAKDIDLLKFLIPHAYSQTASASRPFVSVLNAWYAEHKSPLGSCPDPLIIDAMMPKKLSNPTQASESIADYELKGISSIGILAGRLNSFTDLCAAN